MKKIYIIKSLFVALFLLAAGAVKAQEQGAAHRIVIGFTAQDTMQQKALLNQLTHIRAEWPEAQIEVVTYSFGIDLLLSNNTVSYAKVKALSQSGVAFKVCENTMKKRNIQSEQLHESAGLVKAGIPEIVLKQEQGWSYIVGGY